MISGGVVPGGSCLKMVWETAVNWATAVEGFVPVLKENFDYAKAVIGGRFDVLDIVDRGRERSLFAVNNSLCDLVGRQSGVTPNHTDHRDIDSGKNIGRRLG